MAQLHTPSEVKPGRAPADATPAHGTRSALRHDVVRTGCGREFAVGHLGLEQIAYPAARVTLSTACLPQDHAGIWAGLTPHEARHLAALLLTHATAAERGPSDAKQIRVDYADAERYTVRIPGRDLVVSERAGALGREGDTVADLLAAAVALARHRSHRLTGTRHGAPAHHRRDRDHAPEPVRRTPERPAHTFAHQRAAQPRLARTADRDRRRRSGGRPGETGRSPLTATARPVTRSKHRKRSPAGRNNHELRIIGARGSA